MKKPIKAIKKPGKRGIDEVPNGSQLKYGKFGGSKVTDAGKKGKRGK